MKTTLQLILLLFLLLSGRQLCRAQDLLIGGRIGAGKTTFTNQVSDDKLNHEQLNFGVSFAFSPYFSKLFILSGAEYESSPLGSWFVIPLSARIAPGEKFRPFADIGAFYAHNIDEAQDRYLIKNYAGIATAAGFLWHVNKRWRIEGAFRMRFGLTPAIEEPIPLPGGQMSYDTFLTRTTGVTVATFYRF